MAKPTHIYIDPFPDTASEQVSVPTMGIHEGMPPGMIQHGGVGSDYPSLIMVFHSPVWILAPNRQDWLPAAHQLVIWDYEAEHHYGNNTAAWDHSWLALHGKWIKRVLRHNPIPLGTPLEIGGEALPMRYLQMISDELRGSVRQDPDMLEGLLQILCHDIARHVYAGPTARRSDPRLEQARRYIESRFTQPFNLAETATQAHLSPSYFCNFFARQFGVPPHEYATQLRLQRATQLLANQELAIFQVAEMVGFTDPLYFSRLFRKRYGLSPRQFRRQQQQSWRQ